MATTNHDHTAAEIKTAANIVNEALSESTEKEELTLEEAAVKVSKFRKGSVLYSGLVSGAVSMLAMIGGRALTDEIKLTNTDILKRTAVNMAAAAGTQAVLQTAVKSLNNHSSAAYVSGHLVGCVAPVIGMRVMVKAGFGADGYKDAGLRETDLLAGVSADEVTVELEAPVEAVL